MYTNNLFDFDIDESISNVYPQHHQTFDPEVWNVAEFRTDDDECTYWLIQIAGLSYVLLYIMYLNKYKQ